MAGFRVTLPCLLVLLLSARAAAHKPSDSYIRVFGGGEELTVQWDIALKDLEYLIGLDANQDGKITWSELKAQRQAITAHAMSHLDIAADGQNCNLQVVELMVTRQSDGSYAVLKLHTGSPGDAAVLRIHYDLLFDVDPTHRGLVFYSNGALASTHVFSPDEQTRELKTGESVLMKALVDYIRVGVWHIWIGFDHILFLLSLLLPAVLVRREKTWLPAEAFRPACKTVLKIVTVFTLAHSITLWLAVMEYVTLPSQSVEIIIAFSIVISALNNLYPVLPVSSWAIAFTFGLVHGFGFANVLLDLGLSSVTLTVALLGFNIGVELGQIAIVLAFVPVAYILRGTLFYRWVVFRIGSLLVAIIAMIWMYERIFNKEIIGF